MRARRPSSAAAALALAAVALFAVVAFPRGARAINLQTVNLCNCITPACTNDIPGSGGTLACFVNITSCSYFLQAEPKNNAFKPQTIHVDATGAFLCRFVFRVFYLILLILDVLGWGCLFVGFLADRSARESSAHPFISFPLPHKPHHPHTKTPKRKKNRANSPPEKPKTNKRKPGRPWDYCQQPFSDQKKKAAPPELSDIVTIEGCKCLRTFYTAYGRRYEDSCSDSVTARAPFCYVWPPSCPEGVELQKSSFYPGYFTGFCQQKERPEAGQTRTQGGCRCLQTYRYYGLKVEDGACVEGQRQLAGKRFCYVDPATCPPGRARPSALYEGWFFDLCN